MTTVVAGAWALAWIGATLVVLAGAAKVRRPAATTETLALAGLPDHALTARLLGVGEIVLGVTVLVTTSRVAAGVLAVCYLGFAVTARLMLRADRGSCGCFGDAEAPLGRLHVITNVVLAIGAAVATFAPAPVPQRPVELVLLAIAVMAGAQVVRMLLVDVPALAEGLQRVARP